MKISIRQKDIIKYLSNKQVPCSGKNVSNFLGVSIRTVRNEFKSLQSFNANFEKVGFSITATKGVGYSIMIIDEFKFTEYYHSLEGNVDKEYTEEMLLINVFGILLEEKSYFHLYQLEERLHENRKNIMKCIGILRNHLEYYHLMLVTSQSKGYFISGSEFHKRLALVHIQNTSDLSVLDIYIKYTENDKSIIDNANLIINIVKKYSDVSIPYKNIINLSKYISISKHRDEKGFLLSGNGEDTINIFTDSVEYDLALRIICRINKSNSNEKNVIEAINFAKLIYAYKTTSFSKHTEKVKYYELGYNALRYINEKLNINREFNDVNFAKRLAGQPASIEYRSKHKIPIIHDLDTTSRKREIGSAYEIAFHFINYLYYYHDITFSDQEVAYLSPVFTFLSRRNVITNKKLRGIVVTALGRNYSEIIQERIELVFPSYFEKIDSCDYSEINDYELEKYDIVFTDEDSKLDHKNIFVLNNYVNNKTMINMFEYINILNRKTVLSIITKKHIYSDVNVSRISDFWTILRNKMIGIYGTDLIKSEKIEERESISSFEWGNNVAVIFIQSKNINITNLFFYHFKKRIKWRERSVQVVFVICCKWEEVFGVDYLNNDLRAMIRNEDAILKLISSPTHKTIISLLKEAMKIV